MLKTLYFLSGNMARYMLWAERTEKKKTLIIYSMVLNNWTKLEVSSHILNVNSEVIQYRDMNTYRNLKSQTAHIYSQIEPTTISFFQNLNLVLKESCRINDHILHIDWPSTVLTPECLAVNVLSLDKLIRRSGCPQSQLGRPFSSVGR